MRKEKIFKSNQQGVCPYCDGDSLNYEAANFEGEMIFFKWTCEDCEKDGSEWYDMLFTGHNAIDENNEEVEVRDILGEV